MCEPLQSSGVYVSESTLKLGSFGCIFPGEDLAGNLDESRQLRIRGDP